MPRTFNHTADASDYAAGLYVPATLQRVDKQLARAQTEFLERRTLGKSGAGEVIPGPVVGVALGEIRFAGVLWTYRDECGGGESRPAPNVRPVRPRRGVCGRRLAVKSPGAVFGIGASQASRVSVRPALSPIPSKSVPDALVGFLTSISKSVMARSLVCQDFRNVPIGRRLHAHQHGDNQWSNPGSHTPDKMRFVEEQQS